MKLPGIAVTALAISALVGGTAVAQVTMQPVPNPPGKEKPMMGGHHGHWRHHKGRHHHWHHHHHHHHWHHHHMKGAMKAAAPAAAPAPASPQ
ncbi:MAG: hypothetical protein ABSD80_17410 [Caulobacteraceae bacterium]|jgi:hypothetical protein